MKAILTKVLPATNTKPARIKAYTEGRNQTIVSWSECDRNGRTQAEAHGYAARRLARKMNWPGVLLGGGTIEGYCFVFAGTKIIIPE